MQRASNLLSAFGITAAAAAFVGASCCVLPLLLAWAGLAGAWFIYLEPFVVHRHLFALLAGLIVCAGWWLAIRRRSSRGTLAVLACATMLTVAALLVTEYEGQLQRYILAVKRG
jgi:mercuric ion transport protein